MSTIVNYCRILHNISYCRMKKSRRKNKDAEERELEEKSGSILQIAPETKKSASAILLLGLAAILILASIGKAGPAGSFTFASLNKLFGWGYYLLPAVAVLVAVIFLATREKQFFGITFAGALAFIVFGLGFIDIVFPQKGGLLGSAVGTLEIPFGKTAALILITSFIVVGLLVTFNASFKLPKLAKKETESELELEVIEPSAPEVNNEGSETAEKEGKNSQIKSDKKEISETVEPIVVEPAANFKINPKAVVAKSKAYVAPSLSLLKSTLEKPTSGDLRANANIIKRTLDSFGIPVEMGEINIGPKVTRYTLKPAEGVKIARITALNQDIALSLAAHPIRIEAPIPGKSLVGIEVPNKAAAIVRLGSLLSYQEFANSGPLVFPLGRDVSGEPIFADIEKMPHLLIAGSTGSGKSICIHSVLISLLYKNSPETLKLILVDPKRVELTSYDGIPHLIAPVITDVKKTIGVFRWAIEEMDRRYDLLMKAGSRDIKSYNQNSGKHEPLPYLMIVIDELADLMARYGREVEGSIVRLAQMARATGIHLIVSTQRPSVEVITGLIKANITARVALQVASQIDSRTILDAAGAEKLLGGGDLLFISAEFSKPKRIQGAYLSEEEINKVTEFIADNNDSLATAEPAVAGIDQEIERVAIDNSADPFLKYTESENDEDELLSDAIEIVKTAKKASASLLQRRLRVGYARAARLLDLMEEKGIIGPGDGAKPREILIE